MHNCITCNSTLADRQQQFHSAKSPVLDSSHFWRFQRRTGIGASRMNLGPNDPAGNGEVPGKLVTKTGYLLQVIRNVK